jgi:hypothetical protein
VRASHESILVQFAVAGLSSRRQEHEGEPPAFDNFGHAGETGRRWTGLCQTHLDVALRVGSASAAVLTLLGQIVVVEPPTFDRKRCNLGGLGVRYPTASTQQVSWPWSPVVTTELHHPCERSWRGGLGCAIEAINVSVSWHAPT